MGLQANFPYALPQVTIPNGSAVSNSVMIGSGVLVGLIMPAAWTTAGITFLASVDGENFYEMYDAGSGDLIEIPSSPPVSSFQAFGYDAALAFDHFRGAIYLEIQSGTSAEQVNQGADRTITLVVDKSLMGGF